MSYTTETDTVVEQRAKAEVRRPLLVIVHHPDWDYVGLRATVGEKGALLGRSAGSCLPGAFDVKKVSREHAMVRVDKGQLVVEDLESRNGTYVNGERIDRAELETGDCIGVGGVLLYVTFGPASFVEPDHPTLLGRSFPMAELLRQVAVVADNEHAVTLLGETGTGKELVATAIHDKSGRQGALVAVNCGALAEGVLESELFGHVQGAFTGAAAGRKGLVAQAEGGTLFLDEVTSTPARLQTVLLRLLENGTYRPVGGNEELTADVRVIAAAQPDIADAVEAGSFRSDLWYRLSRRVVEIPSLAARRVDIPLLARHFAQLTRPGVELSPELSLALVRAPWRGNIRELRNVAERIAENGEGDVLTDTSIVPHGNAAASEPTAKKKIRLRRAKRQRPSKAELERVLREVDGRVAMAAERWDVDRKTVYRWIDAHGVDIDALRGG